MDLRVLLAMASVRLVLLGWFGLFRGCSFRTKELASDVDTCLSMAPDVKGLPSAQGSRWRRIGCVQPYSTSEKTV